MPRDDAAGVAALYGPFRPWSFSRRTISTSIIIAGFRNPPARIALPVTPATTLVALLVAGDKVHVGVVRDGFIGVVVGLTLLALFIAALASQHVTNSLSGTLNSVLHPMSRRLQWFHKEDVDDVYHGPAGAHPRGDTSRLGADDL